MRLEGAARQVIRGALGEGTGDDPGLALVDAQQAAELAVLAHRIRQPGTKAIHMRATLGRRNQVHVTFRHRLATLGQPASLFARVFNVFDTRFFNGAVFETTGSPYYTRNPGAFTEALNNPLRYYSPRRIEVGIRYGF